MHFDNAPLGSHWQPPHADVKTAGAIAHPGRPLLPVPLGPSPSGRDRYLEAFGGAPQRPAVIDDTSGEAKPAGSAQGGVTVGHEGLHWLGVDVAITPSRKTGPHSKNIRPCRRS